jgi:BirA family transcriptional regulator, biotin operon repressor / biotin---[acetyl-CoA-carboxylase] ligase
MSYPTKDNRKTIRFASPIDENVAMTHWLHWIERCSSTNRIAIDRAADLNHGDAIFTRQQTAGRGQWNRVWQSPDGVITVSFVMHSLGPTQSSLLSFSAGLAIIDTIETLIPSLVVSPKLKWPNDILIHDRKVAGILCEMRSSLPNTAVIGIGINRSVTFDPNAPNAVEFTTDPISLHELTAETPSDLAIVETLRQCLLDRMADADPIGMMETVRSYDALCGRRITFELPDGEHIEGIARGISDQGKLMIEEIEGSNQIIHHQSGRALYWH